MKFLLRYVASLLFCCLLAITSFAGKNTTTSQESQEIEIINLKQFVNSAIQYIEQKDLQEACKEFNKPQGEFTKGALYIFVIEYTGKILAHGGDPVGMVGVNISNYQDEFGSPLLSMFVDAAKTGGGAVGYYWKDYAKKGTILFKTTYIKPLNSKIFVGAGYYENK